MFAEQINPVLGICDRCGRPKDHPLEHDGLGPACRECRGVTTPTKRTEATA